METIQTKAGLVSEINEAVILINKVKTEMLHYYSTMSSNPAYKANCSVDHDRLNKAMSKLTNVADSIPTAK